MNHVDIHCRDTATDDINHLQILVHSIATSCLELLGYTGVRLSLTFVDEATMTAYNGQYRGKEGPTDVLSFCQDEGTPFPELDAVSELGDILMCLPVIKTQAPEFGVSFENELARMTIHGVLHLCGWDHASSDMSEPMLIEQERIMSILQARGLYQA